MSSSRNSLVSRVSQFLSQYRSGTHSIVFYHSQEMKRQLLFSHIKFGEEGNQGLAYVCSEESPLEIKNEMKQFGIDVDSLNQRKRLTVNNYDRVYIVDGKVNIPTIIESFANLSNSYAREGLTGMRAAAEMSCFFKHNKVPDLLRYEEALHRKLDFHAEGICAYNIFDLLKTGQLHTIMQLAKAHDPVIFAGPKESLVVEPDELKPQQVEKAMEIRL
jgi:hypothetical protein